MRRIALSVVLSAVVTGAAAVAATPPALVHYEGVLRDQNGNPLTGTYDMVFRFMDAATLGNEILVDTHQGASAVVVSGGLFNVDLGSGTVTDGAGPGLYAGLDAVFRDYAAVWLEVQVGAETLAPRTRLLSAPYALNATHLDGQPASSFIDTSSAPQTKSGTLHIGTFSGSEVYAASGDYGLSARGAAYGGSFNGTIGVAGYGFAGPNTAGGDFQNYGSTSHVRLATQSEGINTTGSSTGGFFEASNVGVFAYGASLGGQFQNSHSQVNASLATGDLGIDVHGTNIGGIFRSGPPGSSYAEIPWYDIGMRGHGTGAGGAFDNFATGAWGLVGYSSYKILGSGAVSFAQNHPDDPRKVIVYAAPEGDEVAVYTRGSARLIDGEARVRLGETFALVANPDVGLTATVTPIGDVVPLAVVEKGTRELRVRGPADSNAAFDYVVWGLRVGFEEQSIVQPKDHDAKIPSMHQHEQFFRDEPALRDQTALARFEGMEKAVHGRSSLDLSRSKQLRDAVGVIPYKAPAAAASATASASPQPAIEGGGASPAPSSQQVDTELSSPRTTNEASVSRPAAQALEMFSTAVTIDDGDVVSVSTTAAGSIVRSDRPDDTLVIGCVVGSESGGRVAVAASGIASCRVSAAYGAIAIGDLLSPSSTAGMAMRKDPNLSGATILGRAIEPLESGTGLVRVLLGAR